MKSRFALILALCAGISAEGQPRPTTIPSLLESGQGLAIVNVSDRTGFVTFAGNTGNGRGILLPLEPTTSAEARALSFVSTYGKAFGLQSSSQLRLVRAPEVDALGMEHVRLQQFHQGVPVRAAEFLVHLKGSRVMAANGHVIDDLPAQVIPAFPADQARTAARQLVEKHRPEAAAGAGYSTPRLEVLNRGLLSDTDRHRSRLAWFVEATGPLLRQFIWIDAQSGAMLLSFSQLTEAKSRSVYNGNHVSTLPGTLVRTEGGPATGDADQDNAYTYAGSTYDYFFSEHGRDSFDNAGAIIHSTAHHCADGFPQGSTCPTYQNAFWNGEQMVYADGFSSADDVVAHELTHAVTEYTANLLYYMQSGALNESYSDIFGETVDLLDGLGNDAPAVRWQLGEDVPVGAIRNMMNPNLFSDPGKMSDSLFFYCNSSGWTDPFGDGGGVHFNSGIPNHAYALMVDGGTYNSITITGIGLTKAAKVQYRALSAYLTTGSGFIDNYNALNQSCTDLIGTAGITVSDCTQVTAALLAVEMNSTWPCEDAALPPAQCTAGTPVNTFSDTFEVATSNWTATNGAGIWSATDFGFAAGGTQMAYGDNPDSTSDHRLAMTNAVTIPAGGRLYFDHAFEFENFEHLDFYDGGVLEYSTNGGGSWLDAGSMIDAGHTYSGSIDTGFGNPLAGRSGFVAASHGYTGTRLNLASLVGQNVKFRFRIGTDSSIGSLGWTVDNFAIYSCTTPSTFTDDPLVVGTTHIKAVHITELRTRVNAIRIAEGLSAFSFTDPTLTAGVTAVKAVHVTELRTALAQAYTAAAITPPTYTDPSIAALNVKAIHITELRAAVIAIE